MLRAKFIRNVVLPCEVGAVNTLIAPEGINRVSPPKLYPECKLSGLLDSLSFISSSVVVLSIWLNSVVLSCSFTSFTLFSNRSKALSVSPFCWSLDTSKRRLLNSLFCSSLSLVEVSLSTVIDKLSSVIPKSLIPSKEVNLFLNLSLSVGSGMLVAMVITCSRSLSTSLGDKPLSCSISATLFKACCSWCS